MMSCRRGVWLRLLPLLGLALLMLVVMADAGWAQSLKATQVYDKFPYLSPVVDQRNMLINAYYFQMKMFGAVNGQAQNSLSALYYFGLTALMVGALLLCFSSKLRRPDVLLSWVLLVIITMFAPYGSKLLFYPVSMDAVDYVNGNALSGGQDCKSNPDRCGFTPQLVGIHIASTLQLMFSDMFRSQDWFGLIEGANAQKRQESADAYILGDDARNTDVPELKAKCGNLQGALMCAAGLTPEGVSCDSIFANASNSTSAAAAPASNATPLVPPTYAQDTWDKYFVNGMAKLDPARITAPPPIMELFDETNTPADWTSDDKKNYSDGLTAIYKSVVTGGSSVVLGGQDTATSISAETALKDLNKNYNFFNISDGYSDLMPGFFFRWHGSSNYAQNESPLNLSAQSARACYKPIARIESLEDAAAANDDCTDRAAGSDISYRPNLQIDNLRTILDGGEGYINNLPPAWKGLRILATGQGRDLFGKMRVGFVPMGVQEARTNITQQQPALTASSGYNCADNAKRLLDTTIDGAVGKAGKKRNFTPLHDMLAGTLDIPTDLQPYQLVGTSDGQLGEETVFNDVGLTPPATREFANDVYAYYRESLRKIKDAQTTPTALTAEDRRKALLGNFLNSVDRSTAAFERSTRDNSNAVEQGAAQDSTSVEMVGSRGITFLGGVLAEAFGTALVKIGAWFTGPLAAALVYFLSILINLALMALIVLTPFLFLIGLILPSNAMGVLTITILGAFILKFVPITLLILNSLGGLIYSFIGTSGGDHSGVMRDMIIIAMAGLYANLVGMSFYLMFKIGDPAAFLGRLVALDGAAKETAEAGMNAVRVAAATAIGLATGTGLGAAGNVMLAARKTKQLANAAQGMMDDATKQASAPEEPMTEEQKMDALRAEAWEEDAARSGGMDLLKDQAEEDNKLFDEDMMRAEAWEENTERSGGMDALRGDAWKENTGRSGGMAALQRQAEADNKLFDASKPGGNLSPETVDATKLGPVLRSGMVGIPGSTQEEYNAAVDAIVKNKGGKTDVTLGGETYRYEGLDAEGEAQFSKVTAATGDSKISGNAPGDGGAGTAPGAAPAGTPPAAGPLAQQPAGGASGAAEARPLGTVQISGGQLSSVGEIGKVSGVVLDSNQSQGSKLQQDASALQQQALARELAEKKQSVIEAGKLGGAATAKAAEEQLAALNKVETREDLEVVNSKFEGKDGITTQAFIKDGHSKGDIVTAAGAVDQRAGRMREFQDNLNAARGRIESQLATPGISSATREVLTGQLKQLNSANPTAWSLGKLMQEQAQLDKSMKLADLRVGADVMPSMGKAMLSGLYGSLAGGGGALGSIPIIGPAIREASNEFYQATERARAWQSTGGFMKWHGTKGDASRMRYLQQEVAPMAAGFQYEQMQVTGAFQAQFDIARQAAAEAVARSRSNNESMMLKTGNFGMGGDVRDKDGNLARGRGFMTAQEMQGIGRMESLDRINSIRTEAVMMQGGEIKVDKPVFDAQGQHVFDEKGKLKMEPVSVKLGHNVLDDISSGLATKSFGGKIEGNMVLHYGIFEKRFMRGGDWDRSQNMANSAEAVKAFIKEDVDTDYLVGGHHRMVSGKRSFFAQRGEVGKMLELRNREKSEEVTIKQNLVTTFDTEVAPKMEGFNRLAAEQQKALRNQFVTQRFSVEAPLTPIFTVAYERGFANIERESQGARAQISDLNNRMQREMDNEITSLVDEMLPKVDSRVSRKSRVHNNDTGFSETLNEGFVELRQQIDKKLRVSKNYTSTEAAEASSMIVQALISDLSTRPDEQNNALKVELPVKGKNKVVTMKLGSRDLLHNAAARVLSDNRLVAQRYGKDINDLVEDIVSPDGTFRRLDADRPEDEI